MKKIKLVNDFHNTNMIISLPEWMSEYDPVFIYEEIKVMSLSGNVKYKKLLKKIKKELCGMKDCCC